MISKFESDPSRELKQCAQCGKTKPPGEFYKRPDSPDGLRNECKKCHYKRSAARRLQLRDEYREYNRAYYQDHMEAIKERARRWRKDNPQQTRATAADHYVANRDRVKARVARYKKTKRGKQVKALSEAKRRAQKAKVSTDNISTEQWNQVLLTYGGRCAYCGATVQKLTQDHVLPLSQGGEHSIANLVPACRPCNSKKGARTPEEAGMTLLRRANQQDDFKV